MTNTTDKHKKNASIKHNNFYNYSLWSNNVKTKDKVSIICPTHGTFQQLLNSHLQGRGCNRCAQSQKEQRWMKKYGVSNPAKCDTVKEKTIKTNKERYGVKHSAKLQKCKDAVKRTKKERYGDEHYNNLTKNHQTKKERYNDEHYNNRSDECNKLIKQTKKEHYGDENYNNTKLIKHTNYLKFGTEFASQRNTLSAIPQLSSLQWMFTKHITQKKTLTEIADKLNVNVTTVSNYMAHHHITVVRYQQSTAEKEINNFINSLEISTETSNRTIIHPLELDIYIPSHNIAIEYCGLYWHADKHERIDNQYHKRKHDLCKQQNIQLITIFEDEWRERQKQVKLKIKSLLGVDDRLVIYARKCTITEINYKTKHTFFNNNHIQGDGPGSIHLGLTHNSNIVALMSFQKQKNVHYLTRYATSCRVVGGFSKLLKHFQRNYSWNTLISFADQRWSTGNLYEQTGWTLNKVISPDYSYSPDGIKRVHKFNYRRKNLNKLLNVFNPNLSERINCDNNGILRIWDCGKMRFILNCD